MQLAVNIIDGVMDITWDVHGTTKELSSVHRVVVSEAFLQEKLLLEFTYYLCCQGSGVGE